MAKYSPGGILLLAIGAFLVSIGWTDRLTAVWTALVSGQTDSSGLTPGSPGASALNPSPRPDVLLSWANGKIFAPGKNPTCPSGFWQVLVKGGSGDGANICVAQGDASIAKWDDGNPATCQLWDHGTTSDGHQICFMPPPNNDWTTTGGGNGSTPANNAASNAANAATQAFAGGQASADNYILLPSGVYAKKSTPMARVF